MTEREKEDYDKKKERKKGEREKTRERFSPDTNATNGCMELLMIPVIFYALKNYMTAYSRHPHQHNTTEAKTRSSRRRRGTGHTKAKQAEIAEAEVAATEAVDREFAIDDDSWW